MEFDFYYADLQVGVTFKSDKPDVFAGLTDNEILTLQQIVYLSLNSFLLTRALYVADMAALQARLDAERDMSDTAPDGG